MEWIDYWKKPYAATSSNNGISSDVKTQKQIKFSKNLDKRIERENAIGAAKKKKVKTPSSDSDISLDIHKRKEANQNIYKNYLWNLEHQLPDVNLKELDDMDTPEPNNIVTNVTPKENLELLFDQIMGDEPTSKEQTQSKYDKSNDCLLQIENEDLIEKEGSIISEHNLQQNSNSRPNEFGSTTSVKFQWDNKTITECEDESESCDITRLGMRTSKIAVNKKKTSVPSNDDIKSEMHSHNLTQKFESKKSELIMEVEVTLDQKAQGVSHFRGNSFGPEQIVSIPTLNTSDVGIGTWNDDNSDKSTQIGNSVRLILDEIQNETERLRKENQNLQQQVSTLVDTCAKLEVDLDDSHIHTKYIALLTVFEQWQAAWKNENESLRKLLFDQKQDMKVSSTNWPAILKLEDVKIMIEDTIRESSKNELNIGMFYSLTL